MADNNESDLTRALRKRRQMEAEVGDEAILSVLLQLSERLDRLEGGLVGLIAMISAGDTSALREPETVRAIVAAMNAR